MSPTTVYFDMIIHGGLELDGGKNKSEHNAHPFIFIHNFERDKNYFY